MVDIKEGTINIGHPKIGEIRRRKSSYVIWLACVDCGGERWTNYTPKQPGRPRCAHCANLARKKEWEVIEREPYPNEIRHGREIGRDRSRHYIWVACSCCGGYRWSAIIKGKPESLRCRDCYAKELTGSSSHHWKGGKIHTQDGYVMVSLYPDDSLYLLGSKPKKSGASACLEHRLVMARHMGRMLYSWEVVHHKNGVRDDNRIENLELTTNKEHIVAHNRGYKDGYIKGLTDGSDEQVRSLKLEIIRLGHSLDEERHRARISSSVRH